MLYKDLKDLLVDTEGTIKISSKGIEIEDKARLKAKLIDELVYNLCLNETEVVRNSCYWIIWEAAAELGIYPSSIQELYQAKGREKSRSSVGVSAIGR